jgi:hypothetical protein
VRPPVGEVPIDGDLEAVPLVERHVPRPLGEQVALDPLLVISADRIMEVPDGIGSAWMTEFRGVLELAA